MLWSAWCVATAKATKPSLKQWSTAGQFAYCAVTTCKMIVCLSMVCCTDKKWRMQGATSSGAGLTKSKVKDLIQGVKDFFTKAKAPHNGQGRKADYEDDPALELSSLAKFLATLTFINTVRRYLKLRTELLGAYSDDNYGLPPFPEDEGKRITLSKPFKQWLEENDLLVLEHLFIYSQSAQGYGSIDDVPLLYGLWWNSKNYLGVRCGLMYLWRAL